MFRESTFFVGSIMVGTLTQSAAKQRQQRVMAELEQQLRLTKAQAETAMANERAAQLDMENEVRSKLLLDGALVGLWECEASTDQCKWCSGFYRLHQMDPFAAVEISNMEKQRPSRRRWESGHSNSNGNFSGRNVS